ncbi:hypothetical protein G3N55_12065 [Dissulfurirhabdus thermomarina]|uniref:Uncharacterized protein n=1 Tax=Dissulfurirhabdus thermomarina TaxID=1765737 RepID=A0A6N9TQW9_DISTH|nr:hypothetical protein [Dissulfurirhabdus thermomarina]NDY43569.1 hypothetical protein [Dissulfurirhabdus thermomarina]NMX24303.1 hypothetical protein [Dissulfurirhabdus thermomarina]
MPVSLSIALALLLGASGGVLLLHHRRAAAERLFLLLFTDGCLAGLEIPGTPCLLLFF